MFVFKLKEVEKVIISALLGHEKVRVYHAAIFGGALGGLSSPN